MIDGAICSIAGAGSADWFTTGLTLAGGAAFAAFAAWQIRTWLRARRQERRIAAAAAAPAPTAAARQRNA